MQLKEIRLMFESGGLVGACIAPAAMTAGYQLQFDQRDRKASPVVLAAKASGSGRVFSTIDTAVNVAESIGFREITIRLSSYG